MTRPSPQARSKSASTSRSRIPWTIGRGKSFAGTTVELDPRKDPKSIDVIPDGGPSRGKRVLGIYKLDGDRLMICMAAPDASRPETFRADNGSGCTLTTFRREKPKD